MTKSAKRAQQEAHEQKDPTVVYTHPEELLPPEGEQPETDMTHVSTYNANRLADPEREG